MTRRRLVPRLSRRLVAPGLALAAVMVVAGAGAVAAFESDTVGSFWVGLFWSVSLLTTVGFIGAAPSSAVGVGTAVMLMVSGFVLLSLVSASMASLLVRRDEDPVQRAGEQLDREEVRLLREVLARLDALEARERDRP